ncbi:AT-rich interactive domain-containing protein 4B-like [Anomaloglossus baeobatrachus]|uniref:AT-rich interactive domain-containing protein 4B-like n=1 Tax=Anomaloglossus baeobatrachus TaxID=238106 RepID=UPI003F5072A2
MSLVASVRLPQTPAATPVVIPLPKEDLSTSSSDEDEEEVKTGDELRGKNVVFPLNTRDKKKVTWVPALCGHIRKHSQNRWKRDLLAQSFPDGKFFSVIKTEIHDFPDVAIKRQSTLKPGQKRLTEDNGDHMGNCTVKKLKRDHKSMTQKRKIHLSDGESLSKLQTSKTCSGVSSEHTKMSSGLSAQGKYVKNKESESFQKEYSDCLPKVYKWSFNSSDLENMASVERIAFLEEKLQELQKHYVSLKSELASIDRRRNHSKKKEREGPDPVYYFLWFINQLREAQFYP